MEQERTEHDQDVTLESMELEPLLGPEYQTRPGALYERLRREHGPIAPVDLAGVPVWLALGHAEALHILQNDAAWPKGMQYWRARSEGRVPDDWPLAPPLLADNMMARGGPDHGRYRAAWDAALRPFQDSTHPRARRLKAHVARTAEELISLIGQGGRTGTVDLAAEFSRPLPLMVAGELLGAAGSTSEDHLMDIWRFLEGGPGAVDAAHRVLNAMAELCEEKRLHPGEDFPSYLIAALPGRTSVQVAQEMAMLLGMVADHCGILLANAVVAILTGEGRARANLSAGMVREVVNQVAMDKPPVVSFAPRFPVEDVRMGAYTIRAGDPVWVVAPATLADPRFGARAGADAAGGCPVSAMGTRAHLSWGAGPRQCPARELATTITTVGLQSLFERFDHLALAVPADELLWRASPLVRGLRALPVHYELRQEPVEESAGRSAVPDGEPEPAGGAASGPPVPGPSAPEEDQDGGRSPLRRFLTLLVGAGRR